MTRRQVELGILKAGALRLAGLADLRMIVGRESRSRIAAVSGPGHAECLPGGRIGPLGLPENALDVAGRNTAAAPGFFRGCGGRAAEAHRVRKHRFAGMRWARSGEAAGSLPGAEPRLPPLVARSNLGRAAGELDCPGEARDPTSTVVQSRAEPEVRIRFPPAASPVQTVHSAPGVSPCGFDMDRPSRTGVPAGLLRRSERAHDWGLLHAVKWLLRCRPNVTRVGAPPGICVSSAEVARHHEMRRYENAFHSSARLRRSTSTRTWRKILAISQATN